MSTMQSDPPLWFQHEYNKIRPKTEVLLFIAEIIDQCIAVRDLFGLMNQIRSGDPRAQVLFAMAHALLVLSANIAKPLLPLPRAGESAKERAGELRRRLALPHNALEPLGAARNHLEHYDERMDRYMRMQSKGTFRKPLTFNAFVQHTEQDQFFQNVLRRTPDMVFLKLLFSSNWELRLCGEKYSLQTLVDLASRIFHAAEAARVAVESELEAEQERLNAMALHRTSPNQSRS